MLGKRKSYYVENGIIHFAFEYGKGSLEVLTDNIVNVFVPFECEEHRSKANQYHGNDFLLVQSFI